MNDLTEQDKKRLTEYLGGCWHKVKRPKHEPTVFSKPCVKCRRTITIIRDKPIDGTGYGDSYRTFITWQDLGDLKDKLVEKGEWGKFHIFAADIFWLEPILEPIKEINDDTYDSDFDNWLFNSPRFCWLMNEWLKGKEDKP